MSFDDQGSALAELAQASSIFNEEQTEDKHKSRLFTKPLGSQGTIDVEILGAGSVFDEYDDIVLPDVPALEIPDTKAEREVEEPTPLITIGTSKLYELFEGDKQHDCDIIFVHGLNGDALSTWRSGNVLWPKHLIPKDFPHARVFSFGYEAPVGSFPNPLFADTISENLLDAMTKVRHSEQEINRPIIWVAHSLGGLLVKASLVISKSKRDIEPLEAAINDSTIGIIFLGTPHHARSTLGWANVVSRIKAVVSHSSDPRREVDNAASHTDYFNHLLLSFDENLEQSRVSIYSFYETQEMVAGGLATLVTQRDNALYHPSEEVGFLHGNHITMCKFQNAFENGYVQVTRALRVILTRNLEFRPIHRSSNDILQSSGILPTLGLDKKILTTQGSFDPDVDLSATMASSAISLITQSKKLRHLKRMLTAPVMGRKQVPPRSFGTCEWVINAPEFDSWRKYKTFLVVKGPPGSGKSVIANYLVEYLQDRINREDDATAGPYILHFFFNIQADVKQAGREMLHQFLQQLLEVNTSLVRHFPDEKIFGYIDRGEEARWPIKEAQEPQSTYHMNTARRWTVPDSSNDDDKPTAWALTSELEHPQKPKSPFDVDDLIGILVSILRDTEVPGSYFVIDGLDECDDMSLSLVLRLLDHIRKIDGTKICLTYRQDPALEIRLKEHVIDAEILWIASGDGFLEDIDSFVCKQLDSLTKQQRLPPSGIQKIEHLFRKTHSNTYLWITLITKIAASLPNLGCVNSFLQIFEKRSSSNISDLSRIQDIYNWTLSFLARERDPVALLALCFVAIASRPLTVEELSNFLAASESFQREDQSNASTTSSSKPSQFQLWLHRKTVADPALKDMSDLDNTRRLNLQTWLDSELFGLLTVRGGLVALIHPSLKESIQSYLLSEGLMHYVQRNLGGACLVLLCLPRRGNVHFHYSDRTHIPPIEVLDYAITNWSEHLREARESALQLQSLVEELWKNRQFQPLLLKLAGKNYLPRSKPSLPCVLAAFNLHFNLEHIRPALAAAKKEKRSSVLSMEVRYAAANAAFESIQLLQRWGYDLTAYDENKKNAMDYAVWTGNKKFSSKLERLTNIKPTDVPATYILDIAEDDRELKRELDRMMEEMNHEEFRRRQSDLLNSAVQFGKTNFIYVLLVPHIDAGQAQSALESAVEAKRPEILRDLLERFSLGGQKSNIRFGASLRLAAKKADVNITELLLKYGADSNEEYKNEPSALHFGAQSGELEVVELLVRFRARKSATDSRGRKPIHWAARQGYSRIVQFLASPSTDQDLSGKSALFLACKSESLPTIRVLLEYGASVNKPDFRGRTALHAAASSGTRDIVRLLFAEGADVEAKSDTGMRPLHEAALGGWTEIVEEFLETGATIYALDMSRQTALHHACRSSNSCIDLLKVLLHHGADREAEDDQGQLPLHLAAKKGNPAMVLSLVENIEDSICKEDKYGKTALHNAARAGNTAVVECLLSAIRKAPNPADNLKWYVNRRDTKWKTALHHAVEKAPIELFNSLLDSGANPSLTDNEGNSVLHCLCSSENPVDFVQKLQKLVGNFSIYQFNKRGATPMLCALQGISNEDGKRLNKWEALNEFKKSTTGFEGMKSKVLMMDFWRVLNAGRMLHMWKRKEKIRRTLPQPWAVILDSLLPKGK